jgi:hypothetical protein
MAVLEGGVSALLADVDLAAAKGLHVIPKPIAYGALGHYRVTARLALVNAQAANSRLFSLRNTHASNLIIPTRLNVRWIQTAAHTAAIEDSLDIFKCTGFTVDDTTNTVTPTSSRKRTSMAAAPGNANIRQVTAAGVAAGMTGGTLTKDGGPFAQLNKWLLLAVPTGSEVKYDLLDALDDVNGSHPFVFTQNEGFEIENRVLLGAAAGSSVYIDLAWAEVTLF